MKALRALENTVLHKSGAGRDRKLFRNPGIASAVVLALMVSVSASAQIRTRAHVRTPLPSEGMAQKLPGVVTPTTAGTWTPLVNPAPENAGVMMLLSDGTVAYNGFFNNTWYRLTPDSTGGYVNGTFSTLASMNYTRLYFQSDLLPSGNIYVSGAEYGNPPDGGSAEMYDPLANTWTLLADATTVVSDINFIDGESMVLPDGNVLVYSVGGGGAFCGNGTYTTLIYQVASNTWSTPVCTIADQDETTWVKLPDDSILALDIGTVNSERYIPSLNEWIADASAPVDLYNGNGELGGGFLLPNGKVFYIGGTGQTAIYTPSGNTSPGTWTPGPTLPDEAGVPIGANDAPAAMMVNGNVLMTAGPYGCGYCGPTYFFVYDYRSNTLTQIDVPGGGSSLPGVSYPMYMLDLPDGSVLFSSYGSLYTFTPAGGQLKPAQYRPAISTVTKNVDGSYHVTGTGFNGISQGACYGDEEQNVTNYPIARLTAQNGNVYYARTYNWSSTGVATGSTTVTTEMTVPAGLPNGIYRLAIIANGISSRTKAFRYKP